VFIRANNQCVVWSGRSI